MTRCCRFSDEQEAAILRSVVGEAAALEGTGVAFRTYNKLGRTVPGMPGEEEDEADEAGEEERVSWHKRQVDSFSAEKAGKSEADYLSQYAHPLSHPPQPPDTSHFCGSV
jgi:hypothetical protein